MRSFCGFVVVLALVAQPARAQQRIPAAAPANPYAAIDKHALAAKADVEKNIPDLVKYLTQTAKNDREKARAIYRWMTDRIAYDVPMLDTDMSKWDCSAENVLVKRKSVCAGYANLFQALAKEAGLEGEVVSGMARKPDAPVVEKDKPNHAWNAVKLDDKWQLLDVTWSAGHVQLNKKTKKNEYVKLYREAFFIPPEWLILDHFPTDEKWQLLDKPVTFEEFTSWPVSYHDSLLALQAMGVSIDKIRAELSTKESHGVVRAWAPQVGPIKLIEVPLKSHLKAGEAYGFAIEAPANVEISVNFEGRMYPLARFGKTLQGKLLAKKGTILLSYRPLTVRGYNTLMQYIVDE